MLDKSNTNSTIEITHNVLISFAMKLGDRIKLCISEDGLGISQTDLAKLCGWDYQGRVGNYMHGRREPNLQDIETLAKALRTTPEWLAYGIGNPPAYLSKRIDRGLIPIITWDDMRSLCTHSKLLTEIADLKYLNYSSNGNEQLYALESRQYAAAAGFNEKLFFGDNDIFIVKCSHTPEIGDYVLVYNAKYNVVSFLQYVGDISKPYLTLPNAPENYMIEITDDYKIVGVVVSRINNFK